MRHDLFRPSATNPSGFDGPFSGELGTEGNGLHVNDVYIPDPMSGGLSGPVPGTIITDGGPILGFFVLLILAIWFLGYFVPKNLYTSTKYAILGYRSHQTKKAIIYTLIAIPLWAIMLFCFVVVGELTGINKIIRDGENKSLIFEINTDVHLNGRRVDCPETSTSCTYGMLNVYIKNESVNSLRFETKTFGTNSNCIPIYETSFVLNNGETGEFACRKIDNNPPVVELRVIHRGLLTTDKVLYFPVKVAN